jgi:hypothetical protein
MTKGNRTNNDLQSITQKTKDRAITTPPPKKKQQKTKTKNKKRGWTKGTVIIYQEGGAGQICDVTV